ncbi:AKR_collapsed_G0028160.mRNA.1.CDS.1 [Saccharomyces cerevisiae]|nr:AKR_collapsed_G0028160.mRNA.1.CDS.1 [Saccharomyces cerevisiae]
MHGTCLSGLYPVPFTHNAHDYPHFAYLYLIRRSQILYNCCFNTYVIPLLHHILTTQFIYTYANTTENHHQNHLNIKYSILQQ